MILGKDKPMTMRGDISWGKVLVRCNACGEEYFVGRKELRNECGKNQGWFPCKKCGSHATTWDIDGAKGEI